MSPGDDASFPGPAVPENGLHVRRGDVGIVYCRC
jgi:hypothetical protein